MTEKRKMVSIDVPEDWADAVKKFIADVDGARPEIRGGRAVDYAAFERSVEESAAELEKDAHRRLLQDLDGLASYNGLPDVGIGHQRNVIGKDNQEAVKVLQHIHKVFSLLKRLVLGHSTAACRTSTSPRSSTSLCFASTARNWGSRWLLFERLVAAAPRFRPPTMDQLIQPVETT